MIELINEASIKDIQAKYYPNLDIDIMNRLNRLSPDYNENQPDRKTTYLPWLIDRYVKEDETVRGSIEYKNMYSTLKSTLLRFEQIKNELPVDKRNINKYTGKEIEKLIIEDYKDYLTQKEKKQIIKNESEIVYDTSDWMIVIPKTWTASKFWGLNTKWCTTSSDSDHWFNSYTSQGPLYINIDRRNNKKWQFHFETETFCDEEDDDIRDTYYDSVDNACNMPKEVLDWYENNVKGALDALIEEPEPSWPGDDYDYLFYSSQGPVYIVRDDYDCGGNTLQYGYDEYDRTYLSDNNDFAPDSIYSSDEYNCALVENGYAYYFVNLDYRNIPVCNEIDEYEEYEVNGMKLYTFICDGYFSAIPQDGNPRINLDDTIESFEQLKNSIFILTSENDTYDIVDVLTGRFYVTAAWNKDEDIKGVPDEDGYIYFEGDKYNGEEEGWITNTYRFNINNPGEREFVKKTDNDKEVNEVKNYFWKTTNKLNEINRRNCNDRIN